VGYSLDHAGDTYCMWNPKTKGLHNTRDVVWLKRMYYTKQPPTYDVVIEPVEPRENEVGEGTGDDAQPSTIENEQENTMVVPNENTVQSSNESVNEGSNERNNIPLTRSGRVIKPPRWLIDYETNAVAKYEAKLTDAEERYYEAMKSYQMEYNLVGAGLGGGFSNTNELHVMKYKEAMQQPDKDKWEKSVEEEHDRMIKNEV